MGSFTIKMDTHQNQKNRAIMSRICLANLLRYIAVATFCDMISLFARTSYFFVLKKKVIDNNKSCKHFKCQTDTITDVILN